MVERQPRKGLKSEPMLIVALPPADYFKRSHRAAAFAGFKSKSPLHPTAGSGRNWSLGPIQPISHAQRLLTANYNDDLSRERSDEDTALAGAFAAAKAAKE